jgi:hypothetical protein
MCTPFGLIAALFFLAQSVMPWTLTVDPATPGATPHWTLNLSAPYCGGFRIGDGVYVHPEPPLALPDPLPDASVLFQGQPANATTVGDALRISPAPGTVFSQVCIQGERPFSVELLPEAGLALPSDPSSYSLDLWTGADPNSQISLTFDVPPAATESDSPP